jgi:PTS system mannose-specific IIB component/fructoselysine and glucoselysine-specific PTS system IIB component
VSLDLVRVDDRLIHGQVVVGWGRELKPDLLVLADDDVAANDWEQDLYRMGVPEGMEVEFTSVAAAAAAVDGWANSSKRTIVLISNIDALVRLCEAAPAIRRVNLGGVHNQGGRHQCLGYLFLNDTETEQLRTLAGRGIDITAQDLPNAKPITIAELLG